MGQQGLWDPERPLPERLLIGLVLPLPTGPPHQEQLLPGGFLMVLEVLPSVVHIAQQ